MKRILSLALSVILISTFMFGCSKPKAEEPNFSVKELVASMVEKGYVKMPVDIDDAMAKEIYHLNLDDIEEYAIAQTGISPGFDFILIAKAKDGKVDAVKASVEQVLADKVGSAFYPDEIDAAGRAKIAVDGNYVSLFIVWEDMEPEVLKMYHDAMGVK
ncbi:MAG: DUF4358 domain-containing protein [Oscillospiraceae bacterium]